MKCWHCNTELIWGGDHDIDEENDIKIIFHLGAISSTTHPDGNAIWLNNIFLSYKIWKLCCVKQIKLVYASSAATYGNGKLGFIDSANIGYLNYFKDFCTAPSSEIEQHFIFYRFENFFTK